MDVAILSTEDKRFFNRASKWLKKNGHIGVEVYVPNSSDSGGLFVIESDEQFKTFLLNIKPETFLTVLRKPIFLMQGIVDDIFIQQACSLFSTKATYMVTLSAFYPNHYEELGWGTRSVGLDLLLEHLRGKFVWVGEEPTIISYDDASQRHLMDYIFARKPSFP
jgi:hypothetical protein